MKKNWSKNERGLTVALACLVPRAPNEQSDAARGTRTGRRSPEFSQATNKNNKDKSTTWARIEEDLDETEDNCFDANLDAPSRLYCQPGAGPATPIKKPRSSSLPVPLQAVASPAKRRQIRRDCSLHCYPHFAPVSLPSGMARWVHVAFSTRQLIVRACFPVLLFGL